MLLANFLIASISMFHYVTAPVVDMRESPDESTEIVSQAYFSEEVRVIDEVEGWIKIETAVDHYQGWIKTGVICDREEPFSLSSLKRAAKVNRCMAHLYHVPDTVYGPMLTLPFESVLEVMDEVDDLNSRWIRVSLADKREGYIQRGDVTFNTDTIPRDRLPSLSLQFLGLPYTWGGRSSFGYDCSGFVQMLYRQMGVCIPRDSKDQVKWEGFNSISMDHLSPGDLIFFGYDEANIQHVGMYWGSNQFIHATIRENAPYIHMSLLSDPEWSGSGKYPYWTARTLKEVQTQSPSLFESAIAPIDSQIFQQISYSWKENNPVPIEDLRYVSVNHWGFDDCVHVGHLIVHEKVAEEIVSIFKEIFDAHFPIEKMLLVDAYEAVDERSAQDNNTYAFCSRPITSMVGVFSKHSYGLAIDINPLYNPYCRGELIVPKSSEPYLDRSHSVKGMIDPDTVCYKAFAKRGWKWGGDWQAPRGYVDYQHFEKDPQEVLGIISS